MYGELAHIRHRLAVTLLISGDPAGAEIELRAAHDVLTRTGATGHPALASVRAGLAELALNRGAVSDAVSLVAAARSGASKSITSQVRWRQAAAVIESLRGRTTHAVELAETAVQLISETDWLNLRADASETLAHVGGPRSGLERALELYTRRGNLAAVTRLRGRLGHDAGCDRLPLDG